MQGFHPGRKLIFVLACKYLLIRELAVLDWQKGVVDVRIGFVEMYNESNDILLTVFVRNKAVNIFCPVLNVLASVKA